MRSSSFVVRFLLSYSYLFTGISLFGICMAYLPESLFHPFTIVSGVLFIAGWIWIAKTYLSMGNETSCHIHDGA